MSKRIEKLIESMNEVEVEGVIISDPYNRRYLSGFTGSSGYLLITKNRQYMLTDFRYIEQATNQCQEYRVIDFFKKGLAETMLELAIENGITRMGFENSHLTVKEFDYFQDNIPDCQWIHMDDMVERIRMIKDADEIRTIERAAAIGDAAFSHVLEIIKPGMTEQEIALELEFFMKRQGASKLSFDSIVASGVRSSIPHAEPTNKVIEQGEFLKMDFGCILEGYCSDMTRTIVVGKADDRQKEIYELVRKSQMAALDGIKAGLTGKECDAFARDIISEAGYRENFGHGLGHSLGLEVHEQPRFSMMCEDVIEAGMIMTVEPGIYIPEFGGVRIEDLVLVTEDGIRNFTGSTKELIELV